MARNWYGEAIDILESAGFERVVLVEVAKRYPAALVKAFEDVQKKELIPEKYPPGSWEAESYRMIKDGLKIEAIKHCRGVTGWGLREAKDAVEALLN